jgi:hypothetical protein
LNSIYLITIFFISSPSHPAHSYYGLTDWGAIQHSFLKKTRTTLRRNLAMAENLSDFLVASGLTARFQSYQMKMAEARHEHSGA